MQFAGFGSGKDGILTISSNTTESPVDSSCSGTSGDTALSATNAGFVADDIIMVHQTRGTGAGSWELNFIDSYVAGTITTQFDLVNTYTDSGSSQAQVRKVPEYSGVTINSGFTYTAKAWDGDVGGILFFMCSGTFVNAGTITASSRGFRGGQKFVSNTGGPNISQQYGYTGEGTAGASFKASNTNANGNGAGASGAGTDGNHSCSGSGGNNGGGATAANSQNGGLGGAIGAVVGTADLSTMCFGGGGGGSSAHGSSTNGTDGAPGGGILGFFVAFLINTGTISAIGGTAANAVNRGAGGGGAGGSIFIRCLTAVLGSISAAGGLGGGGDVPPSGNGGYGRIRIEGCEIDSVSSITPSPSVATGGHDYCQSFIHIYG